MSVLVPTPSERLVVSRERLRQALRDISAPPTGPKGAPPDGLASTWFSNLKSIPGASGLIEATRAWWAQHPLRVVVALAADAAKTVVQPVAQRNPLGLMFGAFLVGGLLAWSRPWRRILTPALLVGLLPQLLSRVASNMPAQSWVAALTSLAQSLRAPNPISANKVSDQPVYSRTKSDSPNGSGF